MLKIAYLHKALSVLCVVVRLLDGKIIGIWIAEVWGILPATLLSFYIILSSFLYENMYLCMGNKQFSADFSHSRYFSFLLLSSFDLWEFISYWNGGGILCSSDIVDHFFGCFLRNLVSRYFWSELNCSKELLGKNFNENSQLALNFLYDFRPLFKCLSSKLKPNLDSLPNHIQI